MGNYQLIAATGCPTGIAHTYMAQEALEQAAKKKGRDDQSWNTWADRGRKWINRRRNQECGGRDYRGR